MSFFQRLVITYLVVTTLCPVPVLVDGLALKVPTNPSSRSQLLPNEPTPEKRTKVAVLLNTNARAVSKDFVPIVESVVGPEHVFCTTTESEARSAAATLSHYELIVPIGGDGTLSSMINFICDHLLATKQADTIEDAMKRLPLIAYIPMGTGNGVGSSVGCHVSAGFLPGARRRTKHHLRYVLEQIRNVACHLNEYYEIVSIPMMEVSVPTQSDAQSPKGDLCFFAGVGFDSLMLNDFKAIKAWSTRTGILRRMLSSVAGYCVALVVRTLPQCAMYGKHNINVTVTTHDRETLWVDHRRGDVVQTCNSTMIYSGVTGILAAGTSPFYGGGLRLFPFARITTNKMHLRLGRIHPMTGFVNIPRIFAGSYRDKSNRFGCLDFIGSDFDVKVQGTDRKGFPFQHSGESVGHVEHFRLSVVSNPVRFISLWPKRVIKEQQTSSRRP